MTAAAAKCKRLGESKNIAADKADAVVAAHMPDEDEITKGHQETNQAAPTEARAAIAARGPAAAAAAHEKKKGGYREYSRSR